MKVIKPEIILYIYIFIYIYKIMYKIILGLKAVIGIFITCVILYLGYKIYKKVGKNLENVGKTFENVGENLEILGKPHALICPPNTTQRGAFCYQSCKSTEDSDGTHGCYKKPIAWVGGKTITHLQHKTKHSTVGTSNTIPNQCDVGYEKKLSLCYKNPDSSKYVFNSAGLYRTKCDSGYVWNGTQCGRGGLINSTPRHYRWQGGDWFFKYDQAKARCEKDNPQGCQNWGCCIYRGKCKPGERDDGTSCWGKIEFKGGLKSVHGKLLNKCPGGKELVGRLCYPKCGNGYERRGDNVEMCSTICPSGFKNIGIGGCERPKRFVQNIGGVLEKGICPTSHPMKKLALCYEMTKELKELNEKRLLKQRKK
jgi:hypothetical protein